MGNWWRRRELNPRPSLLCLRLYMLSSFSGSIALSWIAGDLTRTGYDIQRKTTFDGTYVSIGTGTGTDISFTDSSVTVGTTYWYRVFATNANGTSIGSNVVKLTYVEATE